MAKAKKQGRSATDAANEAAPQSARPPTARKAEASAGAAPAARKPAAKKAAKPVAPRPAAPLIDTSLAAEAAAKMVANRDRTGNFEIGEKREGSSLIKQIKQGLNKSAPQGPGGILSNVRGGQKRNVRFGGRNQVGHNQTFGPDTSRSGVPRRTGG